MLTQQSCECLTQQSCDFDRKASSVEKHSSSSSLENSFFENSPVPSLATPKSFTLGNDQIHLSLLSLNQDFSPEEGLHRFPLNPLSPQGTGDLKPGRLGLYSQTSSRPFGVARELLTQQSCECLCAKARLRILGRKMKKLKILRIKGFGRRKSPLLLGLYFM